MIRGLTRVGTQHRREAGKIDAGLMALANPLARQAAAEFLRDGSPHETARSKECSMMRNTTPLARHGKDKQRVVWLSASAAATRVDVSVRTIKRWIAASILPATRLPSPKGMGQLRIRLNDLESVIASGSMS